MEGKDRFARRGWREKIGCQAKLEGKDRFLDKAKGKRQIVRRGWREIYVAVRGWRDHIGY
jgi:hypothetical protein